MIESTGKTYRSKKYEKGSYLAPGKVGKTMFLTASALGLLPPQRKLGGIVDRPSHLHIIAVDSSAVTDVFRFLRRKLGAPEEILKTCIYNVEDDVARTADAQEAYDMTFFNSMMLTIMKIREKIAKFGGTHAVITSSVTGVALALERGIAGPPGSAGAKNREGEISGKGYMDISKWQAFAQQLIQIRNMLQVDTHHCLFEGHIDVTKVMSQGRGDDGGSKETVAIAGKVGRNWYLNTDHTFRLVREFSDCWEGTKVEKVFMDTKPQIGPDGETSGRGQDQLKKQVYNMTQMYVDLGLDIGGWGARKSKEK